MNQKIISITIIILTCFAMHSSGQDRAFKLNQKYFGKIFFKNDTRFVVRNGTKVNEYDFKIPSHLPRDSYSFDEAYFNGLLYLNHKFLINTSGIYHHEFFKEFKKISDFPLLLDKSKLTISESPYEIYFYSPSNTLIVINNSKKQVHLVNAETGKAETIALKLEKTDKATPINSCYVFVERYNKKDGTKYFFYNLKNQILKEYSSNNYVIYNILAISDTLAFIRSHKDEFIHLETHEKYDWVNSLIKPNIPCCIHYLSQSGRYIISRAPAYQLTFSIYDLQKRRIVISSGYNRQFEQWDVYDSRMKDVLPYDMYNELSDIAVSPDDQYVVFSDEDWAVVMKLQDYTKVREYGEYRENIHLKSKKPKPAPNNNIEKPSKICIQTCGFCDGLGYNERASEDCCSQCGGKGYTGSKWISNSKGGEWLNTTCWKCNGTGGCKQSTSKEYCKYCNHTGCYKYE